MRRRDLIIGASAAAAFPKPALAQQALPVVGFLNTAVAANSAALVLAFKAGLAEAGFEEGRNVRIEYRWAEGRNDVLPAMAADLVARRVDVIAATGGSPAPLAARAATSRIPVVFQVGIDPVLAGLVDSFNRPGGNVTGATMLADVLHQKRLELLLEAVPKLKSVALLANPKSPGFARFTQNLLEVSGKLNLQAIVVEAGAEHDFKLAFERMVSVSAQGLVVSGDPLFNTLAARLGALTLQHKLPAIFQFSPFVEAGGLMSYGGSITDAYKIAGVYTGRILKGEKPADLPVQQSTKIELLMNLKTAKALSLELPFMMIARAHEVLE